MSYPPPSLSLFFFFNDPATTEIYTLSLHDALPIFTAVSPTAARGGHQPARVDRRRAAHGLRSGQGALAAGRPRPHAGGAHRHRPWPRPGGRGDAPRGTPPGRRPLQRLPAAHPPLPGTAPIGSPPT